MTTRHNKGTRHAAGRIRRHLPARLKQKARRHLAVPCEIVVSDEAGIIPRFGEVDVLVAMAFTDAMARAASRLKLVQVPGTGLDRIDRSALPDGVYEPGRLVTELTGWIGDRFGLSAGGPADAVERDLSDGRTDAVYRSGFGRRR